MTTRQRIGKLLEEARSFLDEDGKWPTFGAPPLYTFVPEVGLAGGREAVLLVDTMADLVAWIRSYALFSTCTAAYAWLGLLVSFLVLVLAPVPSAFITRIGVGVALVFGVVDVVLDVTLRWFRRRAGMRLFRRMREALYEIA